MFVQELTRTKSVSRETQQKDECEGVEFVTKIYDILGTDMHPVKLFQVIVVVLLHTFLASCCLCLTESELRLRCGL